MMRSIEPNRQDRTSLEEKDLLLQASRAVLECKDFNTAARSIFDTCKRGIGATSGYVALLSDDGEENEILFLDAGGLPCSVDPSLPMPIRGLRAEAYRSQKTVFENDFMGTRWASFMPQGHVVLKNVMFAPLNIEGKTVGIMGLANKPEDFSDADANLAGALAEFAAIALRNSFAEQSLRRERDFAEAILATAQTIILVLDKAGRIVRFNPYMEELSGYSLEEIQGKDWFETFLQRDDHCRVRDVFEKAISDVVTDGNINPIVTKDGKRRDIRWYAKPLRDNAGRSIGLLSIGYDITEQNKLEARLRQSEKMEAIGHLAGGIAHDFNNILSAIIGFTEMALDGETTDDQREFNLRQVLIAANRSSQLVKQILAFSRQTEDTREPVDVSAIVGEVLDLLRASIPSTVEIVADIERGRRAVMADRSKIHEVLINLVTNAVHATKRRGRVTIRFREETVSDALEGRLGVIRPGEYAVIEIADTGTGMNQETMYRIFDPFFTTKPVGEGTGMGLSVVFGIVTSHHGNITVESEPNRGTCFRVYLPASDSPFQMSKVDPIQLPTGKEHILFVDDEALICNMAESLISSLGYRVTAIKKSTEALELLRTQPDAFDLLITDQTMPHMTGLELSNEAHRVRRNLPVVLCSGYSEEITPDALIASGVTRCCIKPLSKSDIARTIRSVLDSSYP